VLTEADSAEEGVKSLDNGADDCMAKPISLELKARVDARRFRSGSRRLKRCLQSWEVPAAGHDRPVRCDQIAFIGEDHPSAGTVDQPDADSCFQRGVSLHRANVRQALNHVRRLGRHPPKMSECSIHFDPATLIWHSRIAPLKNAKPPAD